MRSADEERFLAIVTADPTVAAVLDRAPALGVGEWWLTAGVLFQTVWNSVTGRGPGTGIRDADFFYFDDDTSWDAEDAVIRAGADLLAGLPLPVEIRNEARTVRPNRRLAPRHVYDARRRGGSSSGPSSVFCPGGTARTRDHPRACSGGDQVGVEKDLGAVGPVGAPSAVGLAFDAEPVVHRGVVPLAQQP